MKSKVKIINKDPRSGTTIHFNLSTLLEQNDNFVLVSTSGEYWNSYKGDYCKINSTHFYETQVFLSDKEGMHNLELPYTSSCTSFLLDSNHKNRKEAEEMHEKMVFQIVDYMENYDFVGQELLQSSLLDLQEQSIYYGRPALMVHFELVMNELPISEPLFGGCANY